MTLMSQCAVYVVMLLQNMFNMELFAATPAELSSGEDSRETFLAAMTTNASSINSPEPTVKSADMTGVFRWGCQKNRWSKGWRKES